MPAARILQAGVQKGADTALSPVEFKCYFYGFKEASKGYPLLTLEIDWDDRDIARSIADARSGTILCSLKQID